MVGVGRSLECTCGFGSARVTHSHSTTSKHHRPLAVHAHPPPAASINRARTLAATTTTSLPLLHPPPLPAHLSTPPAPALILLILPPRHRQSSSPLPVLGSLNPQPCNAPTHLPPRHPDFLSPTSAPPSSSTTKSATDPPTKHTSYRTRVPRVLYSQLSPHYPGGTLPPNKQAPSQGDDKTNRSQSCRQLPNAHSSSSPSSPPSASRPPQLRPSPPPSPASMATPTAHSRPRRQVQQAPGPCPPVQHSSSIRAA